MADNELDKDLAKALQVAKKKPRNFAIIAKGANVLKLLVDKKPLKDGVLVKAKKEAQGNAIVKGVIRGDGPELVFQVIEEPSVAEPKLKKFIADTTRLTLKPRFQVVSELKEVDDDAPDDALAPDATAGAAEPSEAAAPDAPPPPAPTPSADQLVATLNKLSPAIKQAVADHPNRKAEILQPVAAFQAHVKAGELPQAKEALMQVGALLKTLKSGTGEGSPPPPDPLAAEWERRVTALEPRVLDAQKNRAGEAPWMTLFMSAQDLGSAGNYSEALHVLNRLDAFLNVPPGQASASAESAPDGLSIMKLGKARIEWQSVRSEALEELGQLKEAIVEAYASDVDAQTAVSAALTRLDGVFAKLNDDLYEQLDDVLNAADPDERRKCAAIAKKTLQTFWTFATSDPLMVTLDDNGFLEDTQITGPILAKLEEIAAALG